MDVEYQHHRASGSGVTQHYVTAGEGRPLVLLHGFPQTWHAWRPIMNRLADRYRIIVPSLRGLGGTPGPVDGYDTHSLAADVKTIVEEECGERPVLICGHDLGSHVAFAYALRYRVGLHALVLVGPPPPGTTAMDELLINPRTWHLAFHANVDVALMLITGRERAYIRHFIMSRMVNQGAISAKELTRYAAAYSAPGALRAALEMYRSLALDRELNLAALSAQGKLSMPVVAVGSADTATRTSLRAVLGEIATEGHAVIVENSGHWIPQEQPDALADILVGAGGPAG